jgi:polysaccharide biosynthesis/export protein
LKPRTQSLIEGLWLFTVTLFTVTLFTVTVAAVLSLVLTAAGVNPNSAWAENKGYQIGHRDVLLLTIHAGDEKQREVLLEVSPEGTVMVPFIGAVRADGSTVSALRQRITEALTGDYFVRPEVELMVKEYHALQYYIAGAVKSPGFYITRTRATLLELIARAGGTLPEQGNIAYIMNNLETETEEAAPRDQDLDQDVTGRQVRVIDLRELLDKGKIAGNIELQSGDVVFIPFASALDTSESTIYVGGQVKKPGQYRYQPGLTVSGACILAGGFDKFAAPNRTRITRVEQGKQTIFRKNLNRINEGKVPDFELKPGDLIYVPQVWL